MIKLNSNFRKDCEFWLRFIRDPRFNGRAKILENDPVDLNIFQTDSSLFGYGVYFNGNWLAGAWDRTATPCVPENMDISDNWSNFPCPDKYRQNINVLVLLPVLISCRKFGHQWRNKRVFVYTDNKSVQSYINRGTSKSSVYVMDCLREMSLISAHHNFHLTARHLKGTTNVIADCLSRLDNPNKWHELVAYTLSNRIPLCYRQFEGSISPGGG